MSALGGLVGGKGKWLWNSHLANQTSPMQCTICHNLETFHILSQISAQKNTKKITKVWQWGMSALGGLVGGKGKWLWNSSSPTLPSFALHCKIKYRIWYSKKVQLLLDKKYKYKKVKRQKNNDIEKCPPLWRLPQTLTANLSVNLSTKRIDTKGMYAKR